MKSRIVILRKKSISPNRFSHHIYKFFKETKLNRYVFIQVKVFTDIESYSIGDKYVLNVKKNNELRMFRLYLLQNYNKFIISSNADKVIKIIFFYCETNKNEYNDNITKYLEQ